MATITINVSDAFVAEMRENWTLRADSHDSFESFLFEFWQVARAEFRLEKIRATLGAAELHGPAPTTGTAGGHERGRLRPEIVQRILYLSATLSVRQLAERFGTGETTIRRILRTRAGSDTRSQYNPQREQVSFVR